MASKRGEAKVRVERTPAGPDLASSVPWYRLMVLTRRFEDEAERAFRRGKIGGYLHLYSGQEAVAAGFLAAIRADDIFFTAYRDHAHAIFRGTPPEAVMAELFGKQTGVAKGKGGSMHLFDVPRGFYGGYGIVGAHIPLATGAAYALRYQGTDRVCLCFLGDGAMNSGSFHEPVNMAAVWGQDGMCPIVYIVENNKYAMGTSVDRSTVVTHLASKFGLHGIENEQVDGQDFLTVRRAAERIVARVRATGRPSAIEAITYRLVGHGAADLFQPYRNKGEVEEWKQRDPIQILERELHRAGVLDDAQVAAIHKEAEEKVAAAIKYAEESPEPPPEELPRDVSAQG